MISKDLFGNKISNDDFPIFRESTYQRFKRVNHYRVSKKKKKCKNCTHKYANNIYSRRHYKCEELGFSYSKATDIQLKNICDKHKYENYRCEID